MQEEGRLDQLVQHAHLAQPRELLEQVVDVLAEPLVARQEPEVRVRARRAEVVVARKLETTGMEIIKSIHPHPTMSGAIMEAAAAAYDEVIHI